MRLLSVELNGFRGFPRRREFDLDADAVVVVGANGHGKTSLFDGILWALTGRIPRLNNDDARLISLYSETGQARVALRLQGDGSNEQYTVIRSSDGKEARMTLETRDGAFHGPSAEGRLMDLVWPDAALASDPREALTSVLTRSVYLQQDQIRHFVDAASDQERFATVSELVGAGRVTELQAGLEREKRAWSTVTNQRQEELNPIRDRLNRVEARLAELGARSVDSPPAVTSEAWNSWWNVLSQSGVKASSVESVSREAPNAIDEAMKELEALRRSRERHLQTVTALKADVAELAKRQWPDIASLRENVATLRKELEDLRRSASEEQKRLADSRKDQAELEEKVEQMRTLAILALKQLSDHCPVCAQDYDRESTRQRLEALANESVTETIGVSSQSLSELLSAVAAKEKHLGDAEIGLRNAEQAVNQAEMEKQAVEKRLGELGTVIHDADHRGEAVNRLFLEAGGLLNDIVKLQRRGEELALQLAQSSALAAIDELRREAETLRQDSADREKVIAARLRTGDLAQNVIEALREAASAVVEERLREISPLLQSIWARIDPHPAFRLVTFFSQVFRGKGQLSTVLADPVGEKKCEAPSYVLSSSQVNALAVSVFLALNIGVPKPPLSVAILDDPLQSLDDVNLLGLIDLFRQAKRQRQFLVSTHDSRFGSLLARKLRPSETSGRTLVIELDGWTREGPEVLTREVKADPQPLRFAS